MVAVFAGFAAGQLVMFQQMGFGLGVAILIDATLVRTVLMPAWMELLGDRSWYLPRFLHWLPDLRVESGPASTAAASTGDCTQAGGCFQSRYGGRAAASGLSSSGSDTRPAPPAARYIA